MKLFLERKTRKKKLLIGLMVLGMILSGCSGEKEEVSKNNDGEEKEEVQKESEPSYELIEPE